MQQAWSEIDVLIFRDYIAPSRITHRFIGSEPFCDITRQYNQTLHELLAGHIHVEEARIKAGAAPFRPRKSVVSLRQNSILVFGTLSRNPLAHLEAHYSAEVA